MGLVVIQLYFGYMGYYKQFLLDGWGGDMLIFRVDLDGRVGYREEGQDDIEGGYEQEEEDGGQTQFVIGRFLFRDVFLQFGQYRFTQRFVNGV